jgi:hypothetical protein
MGSFMSEIQVAKERRVYGLCYREDNLSGSRNRKLLSVCKSAPEMACVGIGIAGRIRVVVQIANCVTIWKFY